MVKEFKNMKYLIFNNEILIGDGNNTRLIKRENDFNDILGPIEETRICVVGKEITPLMLIPMTQRCLILV